MAYNDQWTQPEASEGKVSEFNAAAYKMRRLDKIQDSLNEIRSNLWAWNLDFQSYNYVLYFKNCESLHQEVHSKLKETEIKTIDKLRFAIKTFIKKYPTYTQTINVSNSKNNRLKFDPQLASMIEDCLFKYELMCRRYIDEHGMDTRYDDEEGL